MERAPCGTFRPLPLALPVAPPPRSAHVWIKRSPNMRAPQPSTLLVMPRARPTSSARPFLSSSYQCVTSRDSVSLEMRRSLQLAQRPQCARCTSRRHRTYPRLATVCRCATARRGRCADDMRSRRYRDFQPRIGTLYHTWTLRAFTSCPGLLSSSCSRGLSACR